MTTSNRWMKTLNFRCKNVLSLRLRQQATQCLVEWLMFEGAHQTQYKYLRSSNEYIDDHVNKYFSQFTLGGMYGV